MATELPIACTLSVAEQDERCRTARELAARWLLDWTETATGASLRFDAEAEGPLRELIAAESRCCAFLEFDLRRTGHALSLDVEGPEEAKPIVFELFGLSG
jgi:hypothetical protein